MTPLPSLTGLITFEAVARHLSFSKAGRELHVTQGAISHRIRALEEELGVVLLARTSRKVRLTEPGRVLLRATAEAFARLRAGITEMEAVGNPKRVTVSCSPSFAIRWLVPHLGDLRAHAPEVDLHVSAEDTLVEPDVALIDACIRFGGGGYTGVDVERLTHEVATAVCSPLYLEREQLRHPRDLARCRLLHDDVLSGHTLHVGWREWLDAAGLAEFVPAPGLHFSHSHLALDAAAAGQGVAIARRTLVRRQIASGLLVAPFDTSVESGLTYWLVTPRGTPMKGAMARFRDWLRVAIRAESNE